MRKCHRFSKLKSNLKNGITIFRDMKSGKFHSLVYRDGKTISSSHFCGRVLSRKLRV